MQGFNSRNGRIFPHYIIGITAGNLGSSAASPRLMHYYTPDIPVSALQVRLVIGNKDVIAATMATLG